MANDNSNGNEIVVKITIKIEKTKKQRTFWAIRDMEMGYWRSKSPISEWDAWTRDTDRRAEFASAAQARAELRHIQFWREEESRCS